MGPSADDLVVRAELRSNIATVAREDRKALDDLDRAAQGAGKGGRTAATGLTATAGAAEKVGKSARVAATGAEQAARQMGAAQDASGRWRAANGRFLTSQERANLGVRNTNESIDKQVQGVVSLEREHSALGRVLKYGVVAGFAAAGGAALGFGALAMQVGGDYRDQLNSLQSVTNATGAQMDAVGAKAKALGADTTLAAVSAADGAAAMLELAKGGLTVEQAMAAAQGTLQLAGAAGVDAAQAATIQSAALNQFSLSADKAGFVADVLANTANAAAGEVTDVGLALSYAGPVAAAAGISIEDTASAIGLMANQGIVGEKAGTALRGMLAGLSNPSADASDALATLGIEAYDAAGNFKGLPYLIEQLSSAQGRLTQESFNSAAATAFGREPLAAIVALANEGTAGFDAMAGAVVRQGGAQDVAAAKTKGFRGALEGARSVLETVAIEAYERVEPALETITRALTERIEPAADRAFGFLEKVATGGRALWDLLVNRDFTGGMFEAFGVAEDSGVVGFLFGVRDAVVGLTTFLWQNRDALLAVAAGITAGVVAARVITGVIRVWTAVTTALSIAQGILNGTLALNPIGLVVLAIGLLVGAFVLAWQRSETFRAVVTRAWEGIKVAAAAVVSWFTGTAVPFLQQVWAAIAAGAQWLWATVLQPVWSAIKVGFDAVVTGLRWAWANVLQPVFRAVAAVAGWLWNTVLAVVFLAIKIAWTVLSAGIRWAWANVLEPVWRAVAKVAQWLWNTILEPIFGWIGDNWDTILAAMKIVWTTILKPAFQDFGDTVVGLQGKFETAVAIIKAVWSTLSDAAKKPIDFIVGTVVNDGLIGGFNSVAKLFGSKEIDPIPWPPKGWATGGYTGPGGKYQPAGIVHAGEYVTRKESTARLERDHPGLLGHLNAYGTLPGALARAVGYAVGGFVRPVNGPMTSPYGPRWGKLHAGQDFGVPIGTPVKAAASGRVVASKFHSSWGNHVKVDHGGGLATNYAHFVRKGLPVGTVVQQGQVIGASGNTGNSTGPHLHFEVYVGGKRVNPKGYLGGAGDAGAGGNYGSAGGGILDSVLAPFSKITGLLEDKVLSTPFGSLALGAGRMALGAAKDFVMGKVASIGDFVSGAVDGLKGALGLGSAPKGVERWRSTVEQALSILGLDKSLADTTLRRMNQESSGNPNARNGWDSNARRGQASVGLMQVIPSTFSAYALPGYRSNIMDPLSNVLASMRYALARYGSLPAAYNRKGGYFDGGLVGALLRDSGGPVRHGQVMVNRSGKTEHVLDGDLSSRLSRDLDRRGEQGGPLVQINELHLHADGDGKITPEAAAELQRQVRELLEQAAQDHLERSTRR